MVEPQMVSKALDGFEPEIGAALWRLQDARQRTLNTLRTMRPGIINRAVRGNFVGTILYHLALIEADWLYTEVLELQVPPEIQTLLPIDDRDVDGRLTEFGNESLEGHLSRLNSIRERLLDSFRLMTTEDFHRPRTLPDYEVSPSWVLHHLAQHEAEHRGEIESVIDQLRHEDGRSGGT